MAGPWLAPLWFEKLRGLLIVGRATAAFAAQALLSPGGLPSGINTEPSVLPWPQPLSGVSLKSPSRRSEGPFGQAHEPQSSCHLLSSWKYGRPDGRRPAWWAPLPPWPEAQVQGSVSGKGVLGGFLPLRLWTVSCFLPGTSKKAWRLQRAVASLNHPPPALSPGPPGPSLSETMPVPQGLAPLGPWGLACLAHRSTWAEAP